MLIRNYFKRYDCSQLDLNRPYIGTANRCGSCGGQLYFVRGSKTIVSCTNNDPAFLLLLQIDPNLVDGQQQNKKQKLKS